MSLRINDFLSGLFHGIGIRLVDFKLEFGRLWHGEDMRIVLADEITPDSCRLWDIETNEKLDKDRFRRDLGRVSEAYQEVARRLGLMPETVVREVNGPATTTSAAWRPRASPSPHHSQARRSRPQGKAIASTLARMGFAGVEGVRQGKYLELDLAETDPAAAREQLDAMCARLLANTVIEDYTIDLAE